MEARAMRPKRSRYRIATLTGEIEHRTGWVLGEFGATKGRWFWEFTHIPTGLLMNRPLPDVGAVERKEDALAVLLVLASRGPQEHVRRSLEEATRLDGSSS